MTAKADHRAKADRRAADACDRPRSLWTSAQSQPEDQPTDRGGRRGPNPNNADMDSRPGVRQDLERIQTRLECNPRLVGTRRPSRCQLRGKDFRQTPRTKRPSCRDCPARALRRPTQKRLDKLHRRFDRREDTEVSAQKQKVKRSQTDA